MAKDPAFLMYYQDWLVGTAFMSFQAKGAYMDILCHMADKGPLRTFEIEQICKGNFEKTWPEISGKFKEKNHLWFNEKLDEVMEKRKKFSESRRNNRLGKKKTKELVNNTSLTSDKLVEDGNEDENKDQIKIETERKRKIMALSVIDFLNSKTNGKFRPQTKSTIESISARSKEGYSLEDFQRVIEIKCKEWMGTDYEKYLCPSTLFRATNFENYFNQRETVQKSLKEKIEEEIQNAN